MRIDTTNLIALANQTTRFAVLQEELKSMGCEYILLRFVGMQSLRFQTDVPAVLETYNTVAWGRLQVFSICKAKAGDLTPDGYTVVHNCVVHGDAHVPSNVTYIAIKM